jgi:hypothetical protein
VHHAFIRQRGGLYDRFHPDQGEPRLEIVRVGRILECAGLQEESFALGRRGSLGRFPGGLLGPRSGQLALAQYFGKLEARLAVGRALAGLSSALGSGFAAACGAGLPGFPGEVKGLGILLTYQATPSAIDRPRTSPIRIPTSSEPLAAREAGLRSGFL